MREDGRRCLHTGELEANGYEKNEAGRWFHAAKAEQAKDRFAKALLAETVRFSAPQSLNPSRVPTRACRTDDRATVRLMDTGSRELLRTHGGCYAARLCVTLLGAACRTNCIASR